MVILCFSCLLDLGQIAAARLVELISNETMFWEFIKYIKEKGKRGREQESTEGRKGVRLDIALLGKHPQPSLTPQPRPGTDTGSLPGTGRSARSCGGGREWEREEGYDTARQHYRATRQGNAPGRGWQSRFDGEGSAVGGLLRVCAAVEPIGEAA